jgi:predicted helicase
MYARFFRWASDRLDANGVLAFITNRSFLDSRTFDGFRKSVAQEFAEIRIVDLGGDVRANPKLSGTRHNVFGIQTGVAIGFFVKKVSHKNRCRIFYSRRPKLETAEEKLAFLGASKLADVASEELRPDAKSNWINQIHNDFDELLAVPSKATKSAKRDVDERAIFRMFTLGVVTNRDDWVYADSPGQVEQQVRHLINVYNAERAKPERAMAFSEGTIKWTRAVKRDLRNNVNYDYADGTVVTASYRPFVRRWLYSSRKLNEMVNRTPEIFGNASVVAPCIVVSDPTAQKPWMVLAVDRLPDLHFVGAADGALCLPASTVNQVGERIDNITDWSLKQFTMHYKAGRGKRLPDRPRKPSSTISMRCCTTRPTARSMRRT